MICHQHPLPSLVPIRPLLAVVKAAPIRAVPESSLRQKLITICELLLTFTRGIRTHGSVIGKSYVTTTRIALPSALQALPFVSVAPTHCVVHVVVPFALCCDSHQVTCADRLFGFRNG